MPDRGRPDLGVPIDAPHIAAEDHAGRNHLVLLHGLGESRVGWQPVLEELSTEYEVTALDLPGFGNEPRLPAGVPYTAAALADAVERRLDDLGLVQPHVAGYSLGARVGLELAARGRTRSLIAIAPDGLGTPAERVYLAVALLTGRTLAQALAPAAAMVADSPTGRSFFLMERSRPWRLTPDDALDLLREFAGSPGYEPAVRAALFDAPSRLERISCPVLLLQGTADPLVAGQTPRYLAFLPGARMEWLPGLGHVPISDDPALVARLMLDFLRSAASPGMIAAA